MLEQNIGKASDGADDGTMLGDSEGKLLGYVDGEEAGSMLSLGSKLGGKDGPIDIDGGKLGVVDGIDVGRMLGLSVGICEGAKVGILDGALLG